MIHKSWEDALINSAYLSEEWAVQNLKFIKAKFPQQWTDELEDQLSDEVRHSFILRGALEKSGALIVDDLKYAMQEVLYKKVLGLLDEFDINKMTFESFLALQHLMEKRALWIYHSYNAIGTSDRYKKVFNAIIDDEQGHLDIPFQTSAEYTKIRKADRILFSIYITKKYDRNSFVLGAFWDDYYA